MKIAEQNQRLIILSNVLKMVLYSESKPERFTCDTFKDNHSSGLVIRKLGT